jgi:broad specificity phosphatase PhoE
MSKVYILRHAEKDEAGSVTRSGLASAEALRLSLPDFDEVVVSPSDRTKETARALTDLEPEVDDRAGFAMAPPDLSDEINRIANSKGISFLEAAIEFDHPEVMKGIRDQAKRFNELLDELLRKQGTVLVVSHDLTIIPAMQMRGSQETNIPYLGGFVLSDAGVQLLES